MTIGEHLDELRACLVRSILALIIGCLLCIWPARYLLELLARPLIIALRVHGQPDNLLATSPVETFMMYVKVVIVFGFVVASPYVIHQLWSFVGAGLYPHEKRWVVRLVPVSVGLFVLGVIFMYLFVLLLSLNFLVGFSSWLPMPGAAPTSLEKLLLGEHGRTEAPGPLPTSLPIVPILSSDPPSSTPGQSWFNVTEQRLKLRGESETWSVELLRDARRGLVTTHFKLNEYLSFVLVLTVAFGLAFQVPLVVLFLVRTGIVPLASMKSYRRLIFFAIVVVAAFIAPPDLISHLLLSGPMILLFEIGLFLAGRAKSPAMRSAS